MALERTLPREAYFADAVWQREKDRIFSREWVCAGRTEEVPEPGDYLVIDLAGESVLVVRTRTGELRAFYNVCRHRGCRLVLDAPAKPGPAPAPAGRFATGIRCPYHAWTYTLEGDLRTAPFLEEEGDFRREDFSLWPIAEVQKRMAETEDFKFNVALVNIDFLIRHGHLSPDEPGYVDLVEGLRL